jgi:hypothetical protein
MAAPLAYKLRAYIDFDAVGVGMGGAGISTLQANNPGMGATRGAGAVGVAQSLRLEQAEQILTTTGGGVLTQAEINTAIDALAADLKLQIVSTAVLSTGTTPLAVMVNWATGAE